MSLSGFQSEAQSERVLAYIANALDETPCTPWRGRPVEFQMEAKAVLEDGHSRHLPWIHAKSICKTPYCLSFGHLQWYAAQKIAYPADVCIYCGLPGYTKDHLLPVTVTGKTQRQFVAVVPACGQCNSIIGDRVGHRVGERREYVHKKLRDRYRKDLTRPKLTKKDLARWARTSDA